MGHVVKGRRWPGSVPYTIASGVRGSLRSAVLDAIATIEEKTAWRFHKRDGEDDYIRIKKWNKDYSHSDAVGRDGGRQDVQLSANAIQSTVVHELGHALGLYHEHQRRDRNKHVAVVWGNIAQGKSDEFEKTDAGDSKHHGAYDPQSIMHYNADSYGLYQLGSDWVDARAYSIGNRLFVKVHSSATGMCRIYELTMQGAARRLSAPVQTKFFAGLLWTSARMVPFATTDAGGQERHFILLLNYNGIARIYRLTVDGIQEKVWQDTWSEGWTSVETYDINGSTYLLLLRSSDGTVHVHRMEPGGAVGDLTDEADWSTGWTQAKPFAVRQGDGSWKHFLFLLKESNGVVHINKLWSDGTLGGQVSVDGEPKQYNWSSGWTSVDFHYTSKGTFLILLKRGNGHIHVHRMNANGAVGPRTDTKNWTSGYASLAAFDPTTGTKFFMLLKSSAGGVGHIHYFDDSGTIGYEISPITLRSKDGSEIGGTRLSSGDVSALNSLAPVTVSVVSPYVID